MLGRAWLIARTDLAIMLRQRETLLWVFLMPVIFFYFIGTVTRGFSTRGSADRPDPLALNAPGDGGILLDELVRKLGQRHYSVVRPPNDEEFRQYERRLTIALPAGRSGFSDAVLAGEHVSLTFERDGEGNALTFDRVRVTRAVYALLGDLAVLARRNEPPDASRLERLAAMPRALRLEVTPAGRRTDHPVGFAQAVPGTMVMFTMLVLLTSGAIMLVVERRQGLLRRLASAPISRGEVVLGKWTGRMALGLGQIGFAMLVGTILFGMDWGDAWGMVALILIMWAAFNASLAIVLGSVARSEGQTAGIGVVTTMALAALGGCWWPIEVAPRWMQTLAMFLPTGWTMDALHRLVSFHDPSSAAAPHAFALGSAALALGWLGARVLKYDA